RPLLLVCVLLVESSDIALGQRRWRFSEAGLDRGRLPVDSTFIWGERASGPARAICSLLVAGHGGSSRHDLPVGRAAARGRISRSLSGIGSRDREAIWSAPSPAW